MRAVLVAGLALAVFLTGFPVALPAQAHFLWLAADDPINLWLGRQHGADGGFCCSVSDAHFYDGPYTLNPDGSISLPLGGEMRTIPKEKVVGNLADPNPTGGAVIWYIDPAWIYCFATGALT